MKAKSLTQNDFLSDQELKTLMSSIRSSLTSRDGLLLGLILLTGSRGQEALNVTPSNLESATVTIKGLKGSNTRTLPLPKWYWQKLLEYVNKNNIQKDQRIFPITTRRLRAIWDFWRVNPNKGVHCLRHTFAVKLYLNCHDIHAVKTALGHVAISNTIKYLEYVENVKTLKQKTAGMWNRSA